MSGAKAVLVIGAGDATGGAIARRFAREGYVACVTRRHADKLAPARRRDRERGRQGARLRQRRAQGRRDGRARSTRSSARSAPIEVAVFNIGANVHFPIRETTARVFFKVWEMACFARLPDGPRGGQAHGAARARHHPVHRRHRERARRLRLLRLRRRQACAARARAEHGARAWAAGHPRGARRDRRRDRHRLDPRELSRARTRSRTQDGILDPEAIAENYWHLHCQPRSAWTHELDLRPWIERW